MNGKRLSCLPPMAALLALMLMPGVAAATQIQGGGKELANGATVRAQAPKGGVTWLERTQPELEEEAEEREFACQGITMPGTLVKNQVENPEIQVTGFSTDPCPGAFATFDLTGNASVKAPWTLKIQQPTEANTFVAHLTPFPGGVIRMSIQPQGFGESLISCDFTTTSVQLTGTVGSDVLRFVIGEKVFNIENGEFCDIDGTLAGEITLENENLEEVTVDMK